MNIQPNKALLIFNFKLKLTNGQIPKNSEPWESFKNRVLLFGVRAEPPEPLDPIDLDFDSLVLLRLELVPAQRGARQGRGGLDLAEGLPGSRQDLPRRYGDVAHWKREHGLG